MTMRSINPVKSLKAQKNALGEAAFQIKMLNDTDAMGFEMPKFREKLRETGLYPLKSIELEVLQINIGKMCNQVCQHCHVDAGPDRKEIMTRDTMQHCLNILRKHRITTIDLTGGAPEMNPDFRWFVEEVRGISKTIKIIVRCNLTIILANPRFHDLPEFFKDNKIEVVSSLPAYTENRTDAQRGNGVFRDSIKALKMLNEVGYAKEGSGLVLNLVYNPSGAFLPSSQEGLEMNFKRKLKAEFGIEFNQLFAITNIPISRFLDYLLVSNNYKAYMEKLLHAYNADVASKVMCRTMLSIGWDGHIFDCDFNQMLDLKAACKSTHVADFDREELENRDIIVNQHCYGCTAGAGSSCAGEVG